MATADTVVTGGGEAEQVTGGGGWGGPGAVGQSGPHGDGDGAGELSGVTDVEPGGGGGGSKPTGAGSHLETGLFIQ